MKEDSNNPNQQEQNQEQSTAGEVGELNQETYPKSINPEENDMSSIQGAEIDHSNQDSQRFNSIENEESFSSVSGVTGSKKIVLALMFGVLGAIALFTFLPDTKTDQEKRAEERQELDKKKESFIKTAEPIVAPSEVPVVVAQPQVLEPPPISAPQPPEPPPAPAPITPLAPSFPNNSQSGGIQPPTLSVPSVSQDRGSNTTGLFSSREEEEKRIKAKQDRRSSSIMILGGGGGVGSSAAGGIEGQPGGEQGAEAPKKSGEGFLGFGEGTLSEATLSKTSSEQVTATYIGDLRNTVAQGKIIDAVLETAVNTDLPGSVRGIVSRDVYSESGKNILIPKGSRLIGEYSSQVKSGQVRVSIIWARLIRPDGVDIALESPGSDRLGRAGVVCHLDNKFWTRLGAAFMVSYLIPTLANRLANVDDNAIQSTTSTATDGTQSVTSTGTVGSSQAQESADEFKDLATKVIEDSFSETPTITIDQGSRINVMVNKDLVFPNVPNDRGLIK